MMNLLNYINWNPSIEFGPFRWYGLCWLIGLALAYLIVKRLYKEQNIKDSVNRLYKAYPTKCPVNGRPTGKGSKDKRKLESLLRNGMSESELESKIARYISDCIQHQSFMKNFQTFLNNIPDYSEPDLLQAAQQDTSVAEKQTCTIGDIRSWYPKTPDETEDEFNERIDYICKVKERDGITIIYEE